MSTRAITCRIPVEQADALNRLAEQMSTPHVKATQADALRRVIKAGLDAITTVEAMANGMTAARLERR